MIGVVIVEDEAFIRRGMVLTTPWNQFGCEVIGEAKDGVEGIHLIKKLKPDLVITDVSMPNMDGIEMIKELVDHVDSEFIIVSGYDDFQYAQQAIKLGVKDYLLKPIDDDDFYFTLKNVVKIIKEKRDIINLPDNDSPVEDMKLQLFKEFSYDHTYDARKKYIYKAIEKIKKHYHEEITIKEVSEELSISESYLSRLFKTYTGYTFVEYLTNYRIKMAIILLKDHTIKVYEVSNKVGYSDPKYFGAIFKKVMGVTPMEFKNSLN